LYGSFVLYHFITHYLYPRGLPSFPTRRSSDLRRGAHFPLFRIQRGAVRGSRGEHGKRSDGGAGRRPGDVRNAGREGHVRPVPQRSEEHTSELQSRENLVCRILLEKKNE